MKWNNLMAGVRPNFMKIVPIIDALNVAEMWGDGITEETTVLGVPSLVLRDNSQRPETVTIGTTQLPPGLGRLMAAQRKQCAIHPKWNDKPAVRIVTTLEGLLVIL